MEDKFLQEFLKTGIFDIGDSDDRLRWLQESIAALQKKFEDDYFLLYKYTLVALDPNISDLEPVMIETETIITTYWKAMRGKYTEMPRNIIRGVILNALNIVGTDDPFAARIICLTAYNFFPYAKLNNEKKIVEAMLISLSEIAEKNAVEEWSLLEEEPSLKLEVLKIGNLKFNPIKFNDENFSSKFAEALENDPSGYGPQHGLNQVYYKQHFITKTTEAISNSFNSAFEGFNKSVSTTEIETPINRFFMEFKKTLDANLKASFSSLSAMERRSKLLWWKETLYSSSQKRSYRGLDKNLLPILMSSDLNNQIPNITPISVDYLLRDTLFLLIDKHDPSFKFSDYLTEISNTNLKPILKSCFGNVVEIEGRISITDFIALLVNEKINIKDFKIRTGIDDSEEISLTELSVIMLHDLLTQRLIAE